MSTTVTTTPEITVVENVIAQGPAGVDGTAALVAHVAAADPHPQYTTTAEASAAAPVQSVAGRTGVVSLVKADVGLGNVDNTSDANKPISTAQATVNAKTLQKNANSRYVVNGADDGTNPIQATSFGLSQAATLPEQAVRLGQLANGAFEDVNARKNIVIGEKVLTTTCGVGHTRR